MTSSWDHASHEEFYNHYLMVSLSTETRQRFQSIRDKILKIIESDRSLDNSLEIADIGCGAGTQSIIWAELGHNVHGLDVNQPLLELARERAADAGHHIDFRLGSAVELPWPNESIDVCLVPELLEHVAEWRICLDEFTRVLRPEGILFLSTTNKLCPIQHEYNLPFYSWYPSRVKRYFEALAATKRPEIANFATYPAVNWFSFYSLRNELIIRGFRSMDRFDVINMSERNLLESLIVFLIKSSQLIRWFGHVASPSTLIVAIKERTTGAHA